MTELSVCENCRRIGCTGHDERKDGSCPAYLPHFQGVAISTCERCGGRMRVDRSQWVCKSCGFQRHVLTAPRHEERARK